MVYFFKQLRIAKKFIFEIEEIEILENGNLIKGYNRGIIKTDKGIIIEADKFIYNKIDNIVSAEGDIEIEDQINKYKFFKTSYLQKNLEQISTTEIKAIDEENKIILEADKFIYNKIDNIVNAEGDVEIRSDKYKKFFKTSYKKI